MEILQWSHLPFQNNYLFVQVKYTHVQMLHTNKSGSYLGVTHTKVRINRHTYIENYYSGVLTTRIYESQIDIS